jgi:hypothetical protein
MSHTLISPTFSWDCPFKYRYGNSPDLFGGILIIFHISFFVVKINVNPLENNFYSFFVALQNCYEKLVQNGKIHSEFGLGFHIRIQIQTKIFRTPHIAQKWSCETGRTEAVSLGPEDAVFGKTLSIKQEKKKNYFNDVMHTICPEFSSANCQGQNNVFFKHYVFVV